MWWMPRLLVLGLRGCGTGGEARSLPQRIGMEAGELARKVGRARLEISVDDVVARFYGSQGDPEERLARYTAVRLVYEEPEALEAWAVRMGRELGWSPICYDPTLVATWAPEAFAPMVEERARRMVRVHGRPAPSSSDVIAAVRRAAEKAWPEEGYGGSGGPARGRSDHGVSGH